MDRESRITGNTVKEFRLALDWSQSELAQALGAAKKTIYNWESRGDDALPSAAADRFVRRALEVVEDEQNGERVPVHLKLQLVASHMDEIFDADEAVVPEAAWNNVYRRRQWSRPDATLDGLVDLMTPVLDFVEFSSSLGVRPLVIRPITQIVIDVIVESGVLQAGSEVDPYRSLEVVQRATVIKERLDAEAIDIVSSAMPQLAAKLSKRMPSSDAPANDGEPESSA